ncbi:hypothetical protein E4T38_04535 [Aureobasidium subglaciale]|nr:hypothetical protein E4T38_04535 [Aureobasidium subglaciale]KAI5223840.1 hypothetical protein E4T40_04311 [Aureobasidium subglaciale]KAI5227441.1 hypothetical protein E4T41_04393 [Aureobasidium subglaciale]KAI5262767.1 hypothetical protein E4T46_04279 [Aureobasidium subglaciale]
MSKYQGVTDLKPLILQLNATQQSALLDRLFSIARASNEDIDLSPPVVRIVWVLLAMSTIVVTTRLAVKYRTTRRLYLDDGLMAVALVQTDYAYFAGSFNTFTDLFLTIQPAMLIVHTKLATSNKIGVASLFCLSIIAMIAAVVRTVAAHILNDVGDYTYELTPYITWVSVELNVVLTVTSLPLLRPLAQEARERATRMLSVNRKTKEPWDDTISLRSIHTHTQNDEKSKTGAGVGVVALSATPAHNGFVAQQDPEAVIRTVEVEISYEKNETPMIHAALVGLVQGQAMERLAGR